MHVVRLYKDGRTAGVTPGALTLEVSISAAGVDTYFLHKRYREVTALQAELLAFLGIDAPPPTPSEPPVHANRNPGYAMGST